MEPISVIKPYVLMSAIYGKFKTFLFLYFGFPVFIIGGLCMSVIGENLFQQVMGGVSFLFFSFAAWRFFGGSSQYVPEKTFKQFRGSNEKLKKTITYGGIASIVAICLAFYFGYMEEQKIQGWMGNCIPGVLCIAYGIYYTNKSFKVHGDVDFVTSQEMENIVGVEIDEKIQATYQNFDSSTSDNLPQDANLMIVSDKRMYFSFLENGEWFFVKKRVDEIIKIGIYDDQKDNKIHLKILFSDETNIMLHLESYGKATSNSTLFVRKFLDVLDAVLLGTVDEKISSRRRVSVNQETKSVESYESSDKEIRRLELSNDVIEQLKAATPVESGRVIDL